MSRTKRILKVAIEKYQVTCKENPTGLIADFTAELFRPRENGLIYFKILTFKITITKIIYPLEMKRKQFFSSKQTE
jgi:hypothetical protein